MITDLLMVCRLILGLQICRFFSRPYFFVIRASLGVSWTLCFFSGLCILFLGLVYTWPVSGLLCGSHLHCSFSKSAPTFFACSMGPTLTFSLVFSDTTEERERTREAAVRGSDFFTEVRRWFRRRRRRFCRGAVVVVVVVGATSSWFEGLPRRRRF